MKSGAIFESERLKYQILSIPWRSVGNKGVNGGVGDCIFVESLIIINTFVFKSVAPKDFPWDIRGSNLKKRI